ncbi:Gp49 family protein [Serratia marcescens]|uniref:Gp49 family protein n=1 Tax=Serratia marcescens TaxID=615 RepID=UPI0024C4A797|nr:Gp49 family protein [Serratia marcescens]MDK1706849.1 Gp49 family protein [Serratia marcescens]
MSDKAIEQEIQAKGKTAPRVTPDHIESIISDCYYFTAQDGLMTANPDVAQYSPKSLDLLTFCVLVLKNGFTVTGESACASPDNFDAEIGRKIARTNAVQKIWALEGYLLKQRLHQDP